MSFGEMTITLDDVPTLVGIPVMGHFVNMTQRIPDARGMLVSLLSVLPQETDDELGMVQGAQFNWNAFDSSFPMSWILHQKDVLSVLP